MNKYLKMVVGLSLFIGIALTFTTPSFHTASQVSRLLVAISVVIALVSILALLSGIYTQGQSRLRIAGAIGGMITVFLLWKDFSGEIWDSQALFDRLSLAISSIALMALVLGQLGLMEYATNFRLNNED